MAGRRVRQKPCQEEEHERNSGRKRNRKKKKPWQEDEHQKNEDEEWQGDPARKGRTIETQEGRGERKKHFEKDKHSGNPSMKR